MLIVVEKVLRGREIRRIISIKKIDEDELRVIKNEPSRKEIDDKLEKEIEDELNVNEEESSGKLNQNKKQKLMITTKMRTNSV